MKSFNNGVVKIKLLPGVSEWYVRVWKQGELLHDRTFSTLVSAEISFSNYVKQANNGGVR